MKDVLLELLNFFALAPEKKIAVLETISAAEDLSFAVAGGRLTERLKDYCVYQLIDPDFDSTCRANEALEEEEVCRLAELMLESNNPDLWLRETISFVGVWTVLSRLATEASLALGQQPTGTANVESLRFQTTD